MDDVSCDTAETFKQSRDRHAVSPPSANGQPAGGQLVPGVDTEKSEVLLKSCLKTVYVENGAGQQQESKRTAAVKVFVENMYNELIDEVTFRVSFPIFRMVQARRAGDPDLISQQAMTEPDRMDIFGNPLTRGARSASYKLHRIEVPCPHCREPTVAIELARHLEICMGLKTWRSSRLAAQKQYNQVSNPAPSQLDTLGLSDSDKAVSCDDEKDEDWAEEELQEKKKRVRKRRKQSAKSGPVDSAAGPSYVSGALDAR